MKIRRSQVSWTARDTRQESGSYGKDITAVNDLRYMYSIAPLSILQATSIHSLIPVYNIRYRTNQTAHLSSSLHSLPLTNPPHQKLLQKPSSSNKPTTMQLQTLFSVLIVTFASFAMAMPAPDSIIYPNPRGCNQKCQDNCNAHPSTGCQNQCGCN